MRPFLFHTAPQGVKSAAQLRGRQRHQQIPICPPSYLHPVAPKRQQQPPGHSHRPIGQQTEPPGLGNAVQRLQRLRRAAKRLLREHCPQALRPQPLQPERRRHQHRPPCHRVLERVSGVTERRQRNASLPQSHLGANQIPPRAAVFGSGAKHRRERKIGGPGGRQKDFRVHIRIENAVFHGDAAACKKPQPQRAARKAAGHRK